MKRNNRGSNSPEQIIPPGGIVERELRVHSMGSCITLNDNWGYHSGDREYKSASQAIRTLVECVSKNGNLLLNVGPDAKGEMTRESLDVLTEVGEWLRLNGDSIYDCASPISPSPNGGVILGREANCTRTSSIAASGRFTSRA